MKLTSLKTEAHVWFLDPESVQEPSLLAHCQSLLSAEERARQQHFHFARDRHRYLISHALVRCVLSLYADSAPTAWRFSYLANGRPEIANAGMPALRFNLTHTAGLSACVVTLDDACGVDAEQLRQRRNPLAIAKRMFSTTEYQALCALSGQAALEYFYQSWTLREAFVKTTGAGIAFPTQRIAFSVQTDGAVQAAFQAEVADKTRHWQFQLLNLSADHMAAVAIAGPTPTRKKIVAAKFKL